MVEMENSSPMTVSTTSGGEASVSSSGNQIQAIQQPVSIAAPKKKRNLPGMPDPEAEVIALSPKTLMATNRFVCEICSKGFQRDQNLQLHRRGHNLPWKLKQRTSKEVRKKVYVCPEPSCVHNSPARALGDLTGIKKHFCRKHGEKKWKCERCSKKYAVQSDWKAHMKTCGTKEYKCDCGSLFSRRDSFITHRAFCDALAEETARSHTTAIANADTVKSGVVTSPPPPPITPSSSVLSPGLSIQSAEMPENPMRLSPPSAAAAISTTTTVATTPNSSISSTGVLAGIFASSTTLKPCHTPPPPTSSYTDMICALARSDYPSAAIEPTSLSLASSLYLSTNCSSLFPAPDQVHHRYNPSAQPAMSATALLQKAAEMGAAASSPALLRGFGLAVSSSSSPCQDTDMKLQNKAAAGFGLGLPSGDVMMGQSSLLGSKPTTLDLLGLGIGGGGGGSSTSGLSALLSSFGGGGFNVGAAAAAAYGGGRGTSPGESWEGGPDRKPHGPTMF
ncbi:zf-C2H2 domain-containing protein [Cephalotus follicularis]|uniref:Zf-C2H2 domain-containing protein n=1 Tax=Cephalotus follicularis TaxID=3775 RepID=A0A1Q3BQQ1_CEPFO|nr:zf-C2H2 domain-containing protein [Cephalotus follicularis]